MSFKKTNTQVFTKTGPVVTPDFKYWKKLGVCKNHKNHNLKIKFCLFNFVLFLGSSSS